MYGRDPQQRNTDNTDFLRKKYLLSIELLSVATVRFSFFAGARILDRATCKWIREIHYSLLASS